MSSARERGGPPGGVRAFFRALRFEAIPVTEVPSMRFAIQVGAHHPSLEAFIEDQPWSEAKGPLHPGAWAIVAAHDLMRGPRNTEDNAMALSRLVVQVARIPLATMLCTAYGPDGSWAEQVLLVRDLTGEVAIELGRKFRQPAVVYATPGERAEVIELGRQRLH